MVPGPLPSPGQPSICQRAPIPQILFNTFSPASHQIIPIIVVPWSMIFCHREPRPIGLDRCASWYLILIHRSKIWIPNALPHQAGIELSDFHARVWKSDQGGRNSMQEMHGNQTKCMEFQPIKKSSNFWTSIFCPGINFSCSKSLWIWWTIDPLILACLKLMTYASFSTKQLLAVLMDGNPCTNGWNSMHQNRKNVIASCFFEQSCLRQVKIQDPWQI